MDTQRTLLRTGYLQVADRHCVDLGRRLRPQLLTCAVAHQPLPLFRVVLHPDPCWPLCITPAYTLRLYTDTCPCLSHPDALPHTPPGAPAPAPDATVPPRPPPGRPAPCASIQLVNNFHRLSPLSQRVTLPLQAVVFVQATPATAPPWRRPQAPPSVCPSPANARRHRSAGAGRGSFHTTAMSRPISHNANADGRSLQEPHGLPLSTRSRRGSPQRAKAARNDRCTSVVGTWAQ